MLAKALTKWFVTANQDRLTQIDFAFLEWGEIVVVASGFAESMKEQNINLEKTTFKNFLFLHT